MDHETSIGVGLTMLSKAKLGDLPLLRGLPEPVIDRLAREAEALAFETDDFILHQHDEAHAIFLLLSGAVEFLIRFEGVEDLFVGSSAEAGAILGWSIRREPHRYTASVRCTEPSGVVRLPRRLIMELIDEDPQIGRLLLECIALTLSDRLDDARSLLGKRPKAGPEPESPSP